MIRRKSDMKAEIRPQMRGGNGEISITHIIDGGDLPHGRLLAEVTIPPGAGIGEHPHEHETEYYIILQGKGLVRDNGKEEEVCAGETVVTPHGSKHSIENAGSDPLKMIALIITD